MNPIWLVMAGVGVALAWSYAKTVKAGVQLDYAITAFQVWKVTLNEIKFRLKMRFVNSNATALKIQMISLGCYIDADIDGNGKVTKTGKKIANLASDTVVEIPANKISELSFFPTIKTPALLLAVGTKVYNAITGTAADALPNNVLITGFLKVEGVRIDINYLMPLTLAS